MEGVATGGDNFCSCLPLSPVLKATPQGTAGVPNTSTSATLMACHSTSSLNSISHFQGFPFRIFCRISMEAPLTVLIEVSTGCGVAQGVGGHAHVASPGPCPRGHQLHAQGVVRGDGPHPRGDSRGQAGGQQVAVVVQGQPGGWVALGRAQHDGPAPAAVLQEGAHRDGPRRVWEGTRRVAVGHGGGTATSWPSKVI